MRGPYSGPALLRIASRGPAHRQSDACPDIPLSSRVRESTSGPLHRTHRDDTPSILSYIKTTGPLVRRIQEISPAVPLPLLPFIQRPLPLVKAATRRNVCSTEHDTPPRHPDEASPGAQDSSPSDSDTVVTASYRARRTCGTLRPPGPPSTAVFPSPRDRQVGEPRCVPPWRIQSGACKGRLYSAVGLLLAGLACKSVEVNSTPNKHHRQRERKETTKGNARQSIPRPTSEGSLLFLDIGPSSTAHHAGTRTRPTTSARHASRTMAALIPSVSSDTRKHNDPPTA